MNPSFREDLRKLADEVDLVDLRDRSLATSRRLTVRRRAALTGVAAAVLALVGTVYAVVPRTSALPIDPATASPTPAVTPSRDPTIADFNNVPFHVAPVGVCPTQKVGFNEKGVGLLAPTIEGQPFIVLELLAVATGDIYGDDTNATVVVVRCSTGDDRQYDHAAFVIQGDRTDGYTVRDVVTTVDDPAIAITDVRVPQRDLVEVLFTHGQESQWLLFGGPTFQLSESRQSVTDPSWLLRVTVEATPVVLRQEGGAWVGTSTIRITNAANNTIGSLRLSVQTTGVLVSDGVTTSQPLGQAIDHVYLWEGTIEELTAQPRDVVLTFTADSAFTPTMRPTCLITVAGYTAGGTAMYDLNGGPPTNPVITVEA